MPAKTPHHRPKERKYTAFAEYLKSLRLATKLLRSHVAKKAGIQYVTVCNAEAGKTIPTEDTLRKLSVVYGVSEEELVARRLKEICESLYTGIRKVGKQKKNLGPYLELGKRFRLYRYERNKIAKEVADAIGITPKTLCEIELGYQIPCSSTLRKLAEYYKQDENELLKLRNDYADHAIDKGRRTRKPPEDEVRHPEYVALGFFLYILRKREKLSITEALTRAGLSHGMRLGKMEKGCRLPTPETLHALATAYKTNVNKLLEKREKAIKERLKNKNKTQNGTTKVN